MKYQNKKVLFIFQHYGLKDNVGNYRADRSIKWFIEQGYSVTVVNQLNVISNSTDRKKIEIITVNDPLDKLNELLKKTNNLFIKIWLIGIKLLLDLFLVPDLGKCWANKVIKNINKLINVDDFSIVFSTSPLVSGHLVNSFIKSKNQKIKSIIDLRDGWLDEPLNPFLDKIKLRKYIESRAEKNILNQADAIFVTSLVWKEKLIKRISGLEEKTQVLTNAYPEIDFMSQNNSKDTKILKLIYTGRFTGSSKKRKAKILFDPLYKTILSENKLIEIEFLGNFSQNDLAEINYWKNKFSELGSVIVITNSVPREKMFEKMKNADGFLLLSASEAAIPSKLFEYIALKKPFLAMCPENSSVWNICSKLNQASLFDYTKEKADLFQISSFFADSKNLKLEPEVPIEFSEKYLKTVFFDTLNKLNRKNIVQ